MKDTTLIVFFVTIISTILSSMSGGGAAIINFPVLLGLGIPLPVVIAITRINALFWVPIAAYNYLKDRKIDWNFLFTFTSIGLIGAYFGVQIIVNINEDILTKVIGLIILAFVAFTFFHKKLGLKEEKVDKKKGFLAYPAALIMGFYESILGSGNGIAFAAITFYTKGFDFIAALGYYFTIAFFWNLAAGVLLIQQGYYDIPLIIAASAGSMIGGYIGSKYAKYKGNKFIRNAFMILGAVLALTLIK